MATPLFYKVAPNGTNATADGQTVTLAANVASSPITIGHNKIIRLVAVGANVWVRFGVAGTTTATNQDVLLASHVPEEYDMGRYNEVIVALYDAADSGTSALLNITVISKS